MTQYDEAGNTSVRESKQRRNDTEFNFGSISERAWTKSGTRCIAESGFVPA
jgi:hypothetical protein